jgi:signal transduction histidine kinase
MPSKYTPQGGVAISLNHDKENNLVQVRIKDTGIGVPKEELPYLFEKFSRGKDINRLNTGGTGLGLHVGKKMIEALHGKIIIESEGANKGSTFIVEVPVG